MKHLMYESYVVDENYNIVQFTPHTGKNIQELNIPEFILSVYQFKISLPCFLLT